MSSNKYCIIKKGLFNTEIAYPISIKDHEEFDEKNLLLENDISFSKQIVTIAEYPNFLIKVIKVSNKHLEKFDEVWNNFVKEHKQYYFFLKEFNEEVEKIYGKRKEEN